MNIDEHLKALENLATALTGQVRDNIRLEKELESVWERAGRVERELKAEIGDLRGQAEYYQKQRDMYKAENEDLHHKLGCEEERTYVKAVRALHSIYDALDGVEWSTDTCTEIAQILEHAGYTIHAPGEPEPFIHGDGAEGAEG